MTEVYRVTIGEIYNGCLPVQVYIVQKRESGILLDRWVNIKGFESKKKAFDLLNLLQGGR